MPQLEDKMKVHSFNKNNKNNKQFPYMTGKYKKYDKYDVKLMTEKTSNKTKLYQSLKPKTFRRQKEVIRSDPFLSHLFNQAFVAERDGQSSI